MALGRLCMPIEKPIYTVHFYKDRLPLGFLFSNRGLQIPIIDVYDLNTGEEEVL